METGQGYTIRELRESVGCSDSWIRKHLRKGTFGAVAQVMGSRGMEYRFTQEQADLLTALFRGTGSKGIEPGGVARSDLTALVVQARAQADAWETLATERAERIAALESQARADRERIERLLALSLWDRLRGKHRAV